MAKTSRQTDKSTYWEVTTYDKGEQDYIASRKWASWIDEFYGGLEECPTTKRVHYQGAIKCKTQQRFSAIKKEFPKAHIAQPIVAAAALIKYCMKKDTAVGEKVILKNEVPHFTMEMVLKLLAKVKAYDAPSDAEADYWIRVNLCLIDHSFLVGVLATPMTFRAWKHTQHTWFEKIRLERESIVLQTPPELGEPPTIKIEI